MKNLTTFLKIIFIIFLLNSNSMLSQWEQCNGPYGSNNKAIVVKDGLLLVGTDRGTIFLSTDDGNSWKIKNSGFDAPVMNLYFDGKNIFACTERNGIFLSTDNGETWKAKNKGLTNKNVTCMAFSDEIIYAGTQGGGIFQSTNYGDSWSNENIKLNSNKIYHIVISGNKIFAGSDNGLYFGYKNNKYWSQVDFINTTVKSLASYGNNIISYTSGSELILSTDKGETWHGVSNPSNGYFIDCLLILDSIIYAGSSSTGIFISNDLGKNWTLKTNNLTNKKIYNIAANGNYIYASTERGIFISTDKGDKWSINGIANSEIWTISGNELNVFAGSSSDGIFLSTNSGETWVEKNDGLKKFEIRAIAINDSNIFIGGFESGVFSSSDNGELWSLSKLPTVDVSCIQVSKSSVYVGFNGGVYYSTDNGDNWINISEGLTTRMVTCMALFDNNIFVGTWGGGVFLSSDNGNSWQHKNNGITSNYISLIFFVGDKIFAGLKDQGLFFSTDFGNSWVSKNNGIENEYLVSAIEYDNCLFVLSYKKSIYLCPKLGNTWYNISDDLNKVNVQSIYCNSKYIFVGTDGASVFRAKISDLISSVAVEENINSNNILFTSPNPIQDITTISFELEEPDFVSLQITDMLGNIVAELIYNKFYEKGEHNIEFDTKDLLTGVYFLSLRTGDLVRTEKMVVVK